MLVFRQRERWRYYYRMLSAAKIAQTASGIAGIAGIEVAAPTRGGQIHLNTRTAIPH